MTITVRRTKSGLTINFKATTHGDGENLKNAVMAGAKNGCSPTVVIDSLKEAGYTATALTQKGDTYLKATVEITEPSR